MLFPLDVQIIDGWALRFTAQTLAGLEAMYAAIRVLPKPQYVDEINRYAAAVCAAATAADEAADEAAAQSLAA
jgi:hypothetical protein